MREVQAEKLLQLTQNWEMFKCLITRVENLIEHLRLSVETIERPNLKTRSVLSPLGKNTQRLKEFKGVAYYFKSNKGKYRNRI